MAVRDPHAPVVVLARRVSDKAASVLVCERGTGVTAWLPRSQIKIEQRGLAEHRDLGDLGEVLRITMPAWLAEEKHLGTKTTDDVRQGSLL